MRILFVRKTHVAFLSLASAVFLPHGISRVPGSKPFDVGFEKQLFVDRRLIETSKGIQLSLHSPRKTGEKTIMRDRPWEGYIGEWHSVAQHGTNYQMWYEAWSDYEAIVEIRDGVEYLAPTSRKGIPRARRMLCYATSQDGIHWVKPELGAVDYIRPMRNNVVLPTGEAGAREVLGHVFRDPSAPSAEQYKFFGSDDVHVVDGKIARNKGYVDHDVDSVSECGGYVSPDGIHWRMIGPSVMDARLLGRYVLDGPPLAFWDDRIGKYVAFLRFNLPGRAATRSIYRATASDFWTWSDPPKLVYTPGDTEVQRVVAGAIFSGVDYYNTSAIKYPYAADVYLMFPSTFYHYTSPAMPHSSGPLDVTLVVSRDGISWQRVGTQPFIPLGLSGSADGGAIYVARGIVQTGDELSIYYTGHPGTHGGPVQGTAPGLEPGYFDAYVTRAVLWLDGFVSADAGPDGGEIITPLVTFSGTRLELNVDTSAGGVVRVELLNASGQRVSGYSANDCDPINGNFVKRSVSWKGNIDISGLRGTPVRVRYVMQDARLYAFQFVR